MNNYLKTIYRSVRRRIRRSPLGYRTYTRVRFAGSKIEFPTSSTDLHLTGFPRSGNTMASTAARLLFPEAEICSHLHTISSLQISLKLGIPTLVLFRNPYDSCTSLAPKIAEDRPQKIEDLLDSSLEDYVEYYQFALAADGVSLINFDTIITSPDSLLIQIADILGAPRPDRLEVAEIWEHAGQILQSDLRTGGTRNLGTPEREARKRLLAARLDDSPSWRTASRVFEQLNSHAIRNPDPSNEFREEDNSKKG